MSWSGRRIMIGPSSAGRLIGEIFGVWELGCTPRRRRKAWRVSPKNEFGRYWHGCFLCGCGGSFGPRWWTRNITGTPDCHARRGPFAVPGYTITSRSVGNRCLATWLFLAGCSWLPKRGRCLKVWRNRQATTGSTGGRGLD